MSACLVNIILLGQPLLTTEFVKYVYKQVS